MPEMADSVMAVGLRRYIIVEQETDLTKNRSKAVKCSKDGSAYNVQNSSAVQPIKLRVISLKCSLDLAFTSESSLIRLVIYLSFFFFAPHLFDRGCIPVFLCI